MRSACECCSAQPSSSLVTRCTEHDLTSSAREALTAAVSQAEPFSAPQILMHVATIYVTDTQSLLHPMSDRAAGAGHHCGSHEMDGAAYFNSSADHIHQHIEHAAANLTDCEAPMPSTSQELFNDACWRVQPHQHRKVKHKAAKAKEQSKAPLVGARPHGSAEDCQGFFSEDKQCDTTSWQHRIVEPMSARTQTL
jgi:hypothetical protein